MKFEIKNKSDFARRGVISTAHGDIQTPAYIAPATKAALKALSPEDGLACGSQAMMMNTYHLLLQPGPELIAKAGGLHKFGNWAGPIMTDSGGFQAFSLGEAFGTGISKFIGWREDQNDEYKPSQHPKRAKFDDDGVTFFSHIDGKELRMTPESSIQTQLELGSDIMFAFDECVSPNAPREKHESALDRTLAWAKRCLEARKKFLLPFSSEPREAGQKMSLGTSLSPALFGIVQGGRYEDLRKQSARDISALPFDGFGIGGSFVKEDMSTAVRWVTDILPEDKPRHLLGVGEPIDIVLGVENGIDTFDCVASTRKARTGQVYTHNGEINVTNSKYKDLFEPIEKGCQCETCRNYTCAYLHHMFKSHELNAYRLTSLHNLYFIEHLFSDIRDALEQNMFQEFKSKFLANYN